MTYENKPHLRHCLSEVSQVGAGLGWGQEHLFVERSGDLAKILVELIFS